MQNLQDHYLDIAVLDWDIAEDGYGKAVITQAGYLAGPRDQDDRDRLDSWGYGIDMPVH